MMKPHFESDYRAKLLRIHFVEPSTCLSKSDVLEWRKAWLEALSSWHSPYKAIVDCSQLTIGPREKELEVAWQAFLTLLKGFFLRKVVGFGFNAEKGHEHSPFPILKTEEEALSELGIRDARQKKPGNNSEDFRSVLHFDNHFQQHVVELFFREPAIIDTPEKILILKDKLTNNLMLWHSSWNLLIDCSNCDFTTEMAENFKKMEKFFHGFFLKQVIGYGAKGDQYPFPIYRSRHKAAALLESEGLFSGKEADCKSRKK